MLPGHWKASLEGQGCGIKGFISTSVIQGKSPPLLGCQSLGSPFGSQKWSFPTALFQVVLGGELKGCSGTEVSTRARPRCRWPWWSNSRREIRWQTGPKSSKKRAFLSRQVNKKSVISSRLRSFGCDVQRFMEISYRYLPLNRSSSVSLDKRRRGSSACL